MRPPTRWKLTDAEKSVVQTEMRAIITAAAREGRIITYTDLALAITSVHLHPGSYVFTHILQAVCNEVEAEGGGILGAVVVSRLTGMPGAGYFRLSADLGRDVSDPEACWRAELEQVFALWRDRPDDDAPTPPTETNDEADSR